MDMISLRQLRYFSALVRHRHFGRAAEDCAVTQPALSMQIRELEAQLGADLVERRPGEVALTEIGEEVARRADHIISATRDLEDFARHRGRVLSGMLRLGVIPTVAPYLLPRVLPHLQRQHPGLRLELRETQTSALLAELTRGSLDAILLALPVDEAAVETLALFEDTFLLAIPASDPPSRRAPIAPSDIDHRRLILLEEGHCLRDQALAFCAMAQPSGATNLGATSLTTVMQMVANGYGITLVPKIALDIEARDPRVRLLQFAKPVPSRTIGLAWRRTSPRKADFIALGRVITDVLGLDRARTPIHTARGQATQSRRRV